MLVFLDAPGGTGKTFTLNVLVSWIVMNEMDVATSATSGIAATLLYLGRTAHNRFKLPFHPTRNWFAISKSNLTWQNSYPIFHLVSLTKDLC